MGEQLHGPVWPGELYRPDHQAQEGRRTGRGRGTADLSGHLPQPGLDRPAQRQVSRLESKQ